MALTLQDRFDAKYLPEPNSGCWLWTARVDAGGYGRIKDGERCALSHRVSWELHNGEIPTGEGWHGVCVCHKCDTRSCVNPDHLFLGTNADNITDKTEKGRVAKGSMIGSARLTEDSVRKIKRLLSEGQTQKYCADLFGVADSTIWCIKENRTWRHVPWLSR